MNRRLKPLFLVVLPAVVVAWLGLALITCTPHEVVADSPTPDARFYRNPVNLDLNRWELAPPAPRAPTR